VRKLRRDRGRGSMPTDVRAAGAITLLFGPSTERLCHLTPEYLKLGDNTPTWSWAATPSCCPHA
jgi:hypothetical protein